MWGDPATSSSTAVFGAPSAGCPSCAVCTVQRKWGSLPGLETNSSQSPAQVLPEQGVTRVYTWGGTGPSDSTGRLGLPGTIDELFSRAANTGGFTWPSLMLV